MKFHDTLQSRKVEFVPLEDNVVRMYVCGMTVQDEPHAGHLRTFTSFDVIRRYLEYKGYEVRFVQNFTDIDDKIINRSKETGIDWRRIVFRYEELYKQLASRMNFKEPLIYPKATMHIQEIIELAQSLINKGFAYVSEGNVWYDVSKFEEYGKLSKKTLEELKEGYRIEPDPSKRNPYDFALWKKAKEGEPYWYSPWGIGRPGWHIECSVMSMVHLGETIDIHGGAEDLIFPHHENEIAQSEAHTGKTFSRYWIHTGFLTLKGEKMSKSLGNIFSAKQLLEIYDPNVIRLYYLRAHYRSPLDFSEELLNSARSSWIRIRNFLEESEGMDGQVDASILSKFESYMDDDLNTPKAIAYIYELINQAYKDRSRMGNIAKTLKIMLEVLGFRLDHRLDKRIVDIMNVIVEIRKELRKRKEYELADRIRNELRSLGIVLEDRGEDTVWKLV